MIYDYDGTNNHQIGQVNDWNDTAFHQIKTVYDYTGTNYQLIYEAVSPENNSIMSDGIASQPSLTGDITTATVGSWWYSSGGYTSEYSGSRLFRPSGGQPNQWGVLYFPNKIRISGYNTLNMHIYGYRGYGDATEGNCYFGFGLANNKNDTADNNPDYISWITHNGHKLSNWAQNLGDVGNTNLTIDLHGYEGDAYLYVAFKQQDYTTYSMFLIAMWLR